MIAGITSKAHREVGFLICAMFNVASRRASRSDTVLFRVLQVDESVRATDAFQRGSRLARLVIFALIASVLSLVSDGWSGKPSPRLHQLLLLPVTCLFFVAVYRLLFRPESRPSQYALRDVPPLGSLVGLLLFFETTSLAMIGVEGRHFAALGYRLPPVFAWGLVLVVAAVWIIALQRLTASALAWAAVLSYLAGMATAIHCFPLNYLRSDMLPVIGWADGRWIAHLNPYGTMHVGNRLYDFPYLPGMLVAYAPAAATNIDLRVATTIYLLSSLAIIYVAANRLFRFPVALASSIFLLCPFLQYRHDLYLQAHWFSLTVAVVLMQRRRYIWAAIAWGCSLAIYQLSWVLFPFVLLHAFRRRGWSEVFRIAGVSALAALLVVGPFLRVASERIASNTVGQWDLLPHALADPINVSFWLTYLIRPDHLKWVQLFALAALFGFCVVKDRCSNLADTLRWMACALTFFIPLNVLVDGYFYLTLLLVLLLFLCAANGWWTEPARSGFAKTDTAHFASPSTGAMEYLTEASRDC